MFPGGPILVMYELVTLLLSIDQHGSILGHRAQRGPMAQRPG